MATLSFFVFCLLFVAVGLMMCGLEFKYVTIGALVGPSFVTVGAVIMCTAFGGIKGVVVPCGKDIVHEFDSLSTGMHVGYQMGKQPMPLPVGIDVVCEDLYRKPTLVIRGECLVRRHGWWSSMDLFRHSKPMRMRTTNTIYLPEGECQP
jgi:hypothetical protein